MGVAENGLGTEAEHRLLTGGFVRIILLVAAFLTASFAASAGGFPPVGGAPAALSQAADDLLHPVLEGDAAVPLSMGSYETGDTHASASSYIPVVGFFSGAVVQTHKIAGEVSDAKAPLGLKRVALTTYNPKTMGMYGPVLLCRADAADGVRTLKSKDGEIKKDYWKPLVGATKFCQHPDGSWGFDILKPLEAGHYVVTFQRNPIYYWDFDVR